MSKKREPRKCELCHHDIEPRVRGKECRACRGWGRYWDSLTPEQREEELQMMYDYAVEMSGQP